MSHGPARQSRSSSATTLDFNFNWRFNLADDAVASQLDYDDNAWRTLRLPHDWSIEFAPDPENGDGATAYLPGGIGWYRKHFSVPGLESVNNEQLVFVLFDGIYNHSQVWCNGQRLGENPYGYSPFWFDLTPALHSAESDQVLAVRVDHSRYVDSRWYTGSGIYRDVKLIIKPRLHIPIWGTRLTTPKVTETSAGVDLDISIKNAFDEARSAVVRTRFLAPDEQEVASAETPVSVAAHDEIVCTQSVTIADPLRWGPNLPMRYRAITTLESEGESLDSHETPFGIRTFHFDANEGFFLNGENTLIKGVCLHHDAGLVGAAVPDGVWRRRLAVLKEMGCNAIRTAHNPSSANFLDLCDEMGFLVQLEFFDEWDEPKDKRLNLHERHADRISRGYAEDFSEWAESDLKRTMLRDRNHPCIIQWSIGNEIEWAYTRYAGATGYFDDDAQENWFWTKPPIAADEIRARFETSPQNKHVLTAAAEQLARWTREMDETRPVVANCVLPSVSHETGFTKLLDVVGYSYRQVMYDRNHELYPDEVIMGCENLGQWHEWQHVIERPFISGLFFWTGIHYLGEAHDRWPRKGSPAGMVDLAGFETPSFHMMRTLWRDEPHFHLTTQTMEISLYHMGEDGTVVEDEPDGWARRLWAWHDVNEHWNYEPGELVAVEVYANCETVELFLNGKSLGVQRLADHEDRIFKWAVPFAAGALEARSSQAFASLTTAGEPAAIRLLADRSTLVSDAYDVAHLVAQVIDKQGVPVKHVEQEMVFTVDGPCRVLGVDNGAANNVMPYQADRIVTAKGRALLIVQAEKEPGVIAVTAQADESDSTTVAITVNALEGYRTTGHQPLRRDEASLRPICSHQ